MQNTILQLRSFLLFSLILSLFLVTGCSKDESDPTPPPRQKSYTLSVADVLGVTGRVTFVETSASLVTVTIVLNNAPTGIHPASLCQNTVVEGGPVVLTLNPVDQSGSSSTEVTTLTYDELIDYDGFVRVVESDAQPDIVLAQGDIGGNELTTTKISYTLDTVGTYNVSGTAMFQKRVNGTTLITITLNGVIAGDSYPSSINLGSISSVGGGPVVCTLNPVEGISGKGITNVRKLDSDIVITYDNWLVYDGYINIYKTAIALENVICHGNIGSN
jgi:hypothetical protein